MLKALPHLASGHTGQPSESFTHIVPQASALWICQCSTGYCMHTSSIQDGAVQRSETAKYMPVTCLTQLKLVWH